MKESGEEKPQLHLQPWVHIPGSNLSSFFLERMCRVAAEKKMTTIAATTLMWVSPSVTPNFVCSLTTDETGCEQYRGGVVIPVSTTSCEAPWPATGSQWRMHLASSLSPLLVQPVLEILMRKRANFNCA